MRDRNPGKVTCAKTKELSGDVRPSYRVQPADKNPGM